MVNNNTMHTKDTLSSNKLLSVFKWKEKALRVWSNSFEPSIQVQQIRLMSAENVTKVGRLTCLFISVILLLYIFQQHLEFIEAVGCFQMSCTGNLLHIFYTQSSKLLNAFFVFLWKQNHGCRALCWIFIGQLFKPKIIKLIFIFNLILNPSWIIDSLFLHYCCCVKKIVFFIWKSCKDWPVTCCRAESMHVNKISAHISFCN